MHSAKSGSALYTRCTIKNDAHSNSPLGIEHSEYNGILVHTLYGPVQLHGGDPRTSPTGCVHNLGSHVALYLLGVRLGKILIAIHHSPLNTLPLTAFSFIRCTDLHS